MNNRGLFAAKLSRGVALVAVMVLSAMLTFGALANPEFPEHPLKPPDTSSPRSTFHSFVSNLEQAYEIAGTPGTTGSVGALARAVRCLDLSQVPPELRESVGVEAALMLKEVLDRLESPAIGEIPGGDTDTPEEWAVPHTPITIRRVAEGPRTGEYLFSPETVERAQKFYDHMRGYPYRDSTTPGIYTAYLTTPGKGLELGWSAFLPEWSKGVFAEQTYWQWIALVLSMLLLAVALTPAIRLARGPSVAVEDEASHRLRLRPFLFIAVAFGTLAIFATEWFVDEVVNVTGGLLVFVVYVLAVLRYIALGWLAGLLITQGAKVFIRVRELDPTAASARLIQLVSWILVGFVIVGILVVAGQDFGFPVYSIVTGLGVGGIAIGFGAQSLVRDVLSGVFFLVDDAFREGEYIQAGTAKGTVEKISIRSVQLRHHNGPLNTIPFSEIRQVTKPCPRDWVIMKLPIRVPFGTDPERVRKIVKKLGLQLLEDPELGPQFLEPLKSQGVLQLDDFGIVIRVKYMTRPGDQFTLRRTVYAKIQETFEKEGIPFAGREVRIKVDDDGESQNEEKIPSTAVAQAAEIGDGEVPVKKTR